MPRTLLRRLGTSALAASAVLAGSLVAAPAASADTNVWDRVAMCESSGRWDINTGNGFYGGLQFWHPTWTGFGGQEFAGYAHQASKLDQITVAQRVLRVQGPGAWPVCSVRAGLTMQNGLAPYPGAGDPADPAPGALVVDGIRGPKTTAAIQFWVGTTQDGKFGPITTRALQSKVGTVADGIWGPKSQAALQDHLGISRDGSTFMNSRTVTALQRYLNDRIL